MTSTSDIQDEAFASTSCVSREEALQLCSKLAIVYELPGVTSTRTMKDSVTAATAEIHDAVDNVHDIIGDIKLDKAFLKPSWDYQKLATYHKVVCNQTHGLVMKTSVLRSLHPLLHTFFLIADAPSIGVSVKKRLSSEVELVFTGEDEHLLSGPVDPEKICAMTDMDLQWFSVVKKGKRSPFSTAQTTLAQALILLRLIESWEAHLDVSLKTLVEEREIGASRCKARSFQERQEAGQSEEAQIAQADLFESMGEARATAEACVLHYGTAGENSCIELSHHPSSAACDTTEMTTPSLSSTTSSVPSTTTSQSECESIPTLEEADEFFDCEEEMRTSKSLIRSSFTWLIGTIA